MHIYIGPTVHFWYYNIGCFDVYFSYFYTYVTAESAVITKNRNDIYGTRNKKKYEGRAHTKVFTIPNVYIFVNNYF